MIKGKVVKIIDEYNLVADVGGNNGVEEGMEFIVYEEGSEIEDPETGESLGELEYQKARVKVAHVMPEMSVLESQETEMRKVDDSLLNPFQKVFGDRRVEVTKSLPLEDEPDERIVNKNIQLGDPVREYEPDDYLYGTG